MDDYSGQGRRRASYDDGRYGDSRYSSSRREGGSYDASQYDASRYSARSRQESGTRYRSGEAPRRSAASDSGYRSTVRTANRTTLRQSDYSTRSRSDAPASANGARSRQAAPRRSAQQRNARSYSGGSYGNYGGNGGGFLDGPWPKRIIMAIAAIVIVVLLVNLVTCVARGIGGSQESSASSASASQTIEVSSASAASQSSAAATLGPNEGVEDKWVEGGRFTTGDAELDQMVKTFCDDNSNPELSAADNAFNVYCAVVWGEYIEIDENQEPLGPNWDIEYAKQYITEGGGNCYNYCAFNEYVLKYFGYSDATAEPCIVLRQSGDYGDHGLVFVTNIEDGRRCLCDSAFGANGWMLDIDSYTMQVRNIGQDPSEFTVAPFEDISVAPWYNGATSA
ncbi:MAG: hypothetical protein IJ111_11190 [Eggerthellaceae bacterium]|nr:hypothetical protein [Eggerthellaceae bacterium]